MAIETKIEHFLEIKFNSTVTYLQFYNDPYDAAKYNQ